MTFSVFLRSGAKALAHGGATGEAAGSIVKRAADHLITNLGNDAFTLIAPSAKHGVGSNDVAVTLNTLKGKLDSFDGVTATIKDGKFLELSFERFKNIGKFFNLVGNWFKKAGAEIGSWFRWVPGFGNGERKDAIKGIVDKLTGDGGEALSKDSSTIFDVMERTIKEVLANEKLVNKDNPWATFKNIDTIVGQVREKLYKAASS